MTEYEYERGNVNNPDRTYPEGHAFEGHQKFLAKDIEESLPGKEFKVRCDGTSLIVCFMEALSSGDKTTLDQAIADHKNNA